MEMTFQQYIDNPMGKKNAVFSQRGMYKNLYTEKFDKVFLREAGKINFTLYIDRKHDKYIAHIKVPSETVKDFYYDAVIMFYTNDAGIRSSNNLQNYYVKFFSNDPAFVFTYLRVFLKNDLFIEDLKSRASKLALKKDPDIKNPYQVPGYSKILYFAFLFMKNKNLFSKSMYTSYGEKYDPKTLAKNVEDTDTKIAKRQEAGEKQRKEDKSEKEDNTSDSKRLNPIASPSGNIKKTKSVGLVKSVGGVKRTKTTKRINKK